MSNSDEARTYIPALKYGKKIYAGDMKDAPAYVIVYAGEATTAGGDATETVTVTGALATDIVFANVQTEGSTPVTLDAVAVTADTVTATFSADPSTDHVWSYMVIRAVTALG